MASQQREGGGEATVLQGTIWGSYTGTYRGTVTAPTRGVLWGEYSAKPEGHGDYDGDGVYTHWAYSGQWTGGVPKGVGWRLKEGSVYAGEVDAGRRHGRGVYWSRDGRRCFEGNWVNGYPYGEGTLLYENGELWRVRFSGWAGLQADDGWDKAVRLSRLGRVMSNGPAPVARREGRGVAPAWIATVALPGGKMAWRQMRGLTQARGRVVCVHACACMRACELFVIARVRVRV
jgi:hypothetical protein